MYLVLVSLKESDCAVDLLPSSTHLIMINRGKVTLKLCPVIVDNLVLSIIAYCIYRLYYSVITIAGLCRKGAVLLYSSPLSHAHSEPVSYADTKPVRALSTRLHSHGLFCIETQA